MSDPTNIPCAAGPGYVHFNPENASQCVFCRPKPTPLGKAPPNINLSDAEWSGLTPQGQTFIKEAEAGSLSYLVREDDGTPYAWGVAYAGLFSVDIKAQPNEHDGYIIDIRHPHPVHQHVNSNGRFMLLVGPNNGGEDYAAQIYVWKLSMHKDFGIDHPRTPFLVCTNHTWHITDRKAIAERDACLGIEHVTDAQLMEILALPVTTPSRLP